MNNSKKIKIVNYGIVILLLVLSTYIFLDGYTNNAFMNAVNFRTYISNYGLFAPIIFILFQIIQVIIPIIPSFLGYAGGVAMFGILQGFLYNYIGIALGSLFAFILARKYGKKFVKLIVKEHTYKKCTKWLEKNKSFPFALFLAILLPLAPDDVLCYLSGLTKMSFAKFSWIIFIAKPWCILMYCLAVGGIL